MKEIDQMSLPELRVLAVETDSLNVLWAIMDNCKGDAHAIQKIIENPLARFDTNLVRMAYQQGDIRVKATIARHVADDELINESVESDDRQIRSAAALNPNIHLMWLAKLTHDPVWAVRVSTLSNPQINQEMLEYMSDDLNFTVRNIAREILRKMQEQK